MVTGRPLRWISSAIWMPDAEAPTTSTPCSVSWVGDRYVIGVSISIVVGVACANAGTLAMLAAPLATTTVAHVQTPRSVITS